MTKMMSLALMISCSQTRNGQFRFQAYMATSGFWGSGGVWKRQCISWFGKGRRLEPILTIMARLRIEVFRLFPISMKGLWTTSRTIWRPMRNRRKSVRAGLRRGSASSASRPECPWIMRPGVQEALCRRWLGPLAHLSPNPCCCPPYRGQGIGVRFFEERGGLCPQPWPVRALLLLRGGASCRSSAAPCRLRSAQRLLEQARPCISRSFAPPNSRGATLARIRGKHKPCRSGYEGTALMVSLPRGVHPGCSTAGMPTPCIWSNWPVTVEAGAQLLLLRIIPPWRSPEAVTGKEGARRPANRRRDPAAHPALAGPVRPSRTSPWRVVLPGSAPFSIRT